MERAKRIWERGGRSGGLGGAACVALACSRFLVEPANSFATRLVVEDVSSVRGVPVAN